MQHPTTQPDSPFNLLINDLAAMRDRRQIEANARIARHAHEAARNRRMAQRPLPLKKSAPLPDYRKPDWDSLTARQNAIAADLEQSRIQAQQDAIRAHLATLRQAAKSGRLTAHQICLLDVYTGQALAMGLTP